MDTGVYEIVNTVNGKRYIGSAVRFKSRWAGHKSRLRLGKHSNPKLQRAWNKYGPEAFKFLPILTCQKSMLLFYEQQLLDKVKPEYNVALVAAAPMTGRKHSDETKEKMRMRTHSDEVRAKMSVAHKGQAPMQGRRHSEAVKEKFKLRVCSEETREKMRISHTGKKHTAATRAKISAAQRGQKKPQLAELNRARRKPTQGGN